MDRALARIDEAIQVKPSDPTLLGRRIGILRVFPFPGEPVEKGAVNGRRSISRHQQMQTG